MTDVEPFAEEVPDIERHLLVLRRAAIGSSTLQAAVDGLWAEVLRLRRVAASPITVGASWGHRGQTTAPSGRRRVDVANRDAAALLDQIDRVLAALRPVHASITGLRAAVETGTGVARIEKLMAELDQVGSLLRVSRATTAAVSRGLTRDAFWEMVTTQAMSCAICHRLFSATVKPHVDHNHETGEVRGVLCHRCNTGIGQLFDSPSILANALAYLNTRGHYGPDALENTA